MLTVLIWPPRYSTQVRRDAKGHLKIYMLPAGDDGGRYEVAGINERYNKDTADVDQAAAL